MRFVYIVIGCLMVALGVIGIFVPLMPTTVFLLAAGWAFAKSSPRLEAWLVHHPRLGPPIRDWRERGAIHIRAKILAVSMMAISLAYILWAPAIPIYGKIAAALVLACCATFILTRPSS
ncbi:YbaN family protein [Rhizobium sp.]